MNQLPLGWTEATIDEINLYKSRNITPSDFPNEGFELYSVPIFPTGKPEYAKGSEVGSSKQEVLHDDVLLCKINPRINRVWCVAEKQKKRQIASSEWIVIRNELLSSNYLRYALTREEFREILCSEVSGVGGSLTRAQPKKVATYKIPLAPLPEQIRIANKLDSLLAKVETAQTRLEKIPALLKRFRQAVLAAATSGELTREWREENIGLCQSLSSLGVIAEYDGKELIPLCETWCYLPFEKSATIKSNLVDPLLTPDAIHLAPNHIESNTGRVIGKATVSDDGVMSNKHKFFSGQIVYSKIRPYLNKVCLVDFDGVCSADMYPVEAHINTHYLLIYMLSDQFVTWTAQKQGRVVLPKINQKALNKIPVPVPSENEQAEIVRRVESLFAMADTVEKQYQAAKARLDKLTQAILAKAFRGELVPQDPNDEPAAKLLKRIQAGKQEKSLASCVNAMQPVLMP